MNETILIVFLLIIIIIFIYLHFKQIKLVEYYGEKFIVRNQPNSDIAAQYIYKIKNKLYTLLECINTNNKINLNLNNKYKKYEKYLLKSVEDTMLKFKNNQIKFRENTKNNDLTS